MEINYIIYASLAIIYILSFLKIFEKAGRKSWEAIIPFYNIIIWMKILHRPWWWALLLIFPGVNILMLIVMNVNTAIVFNKREMKDSLMAIFLPFVLLPQLAFNKGASYVGPVDKSKLKKSAFREWGDAIVFAIVAASIIRTYFFEAFTIPTSSMEKTLLKGDYLFVSKIHYGPKIPNTPLSIPFAHHTIPLTQSTPSYLEWQKLPYFRLPGFNEVKRNDIVVFNFPEGDTVAVNQQAQSYYDLSRRYGRSTVLNNKPVIDQASGRVAQNYFGKITVRPIDKKENYIKRCVGVPGDKLEINNGILSINGESAFQHEMVQFRYFLRTKDMLAQRNLKTTLDINPEDARHLGQDPTTKEHLYAMVLTDAGKEAMTKYPVVSSIENRIEQRNPNNPTTDCFPNDKTYSWTRDNFGPITIPKAGETIELNLNNLPLYKRLISSYENNDLQIKKGKIFINGQETSSYTFKMNYYWLMGDSRHNSQDSRFWGFVPEDHVVGKAVFIWLSLDPDKGLFDGKIRWNRLFSIVHD